ncbi:MAG: glucose-1-phosphate cytidylyltransferase, partial [Christensenella sp.]
REKSREDMGLINGGFMVLEPKIFDYIGGDDTILEREPLEKLAQEHELMAFKHEGFWQCMDTLRDKQLLDKLLAKNEAPWKVWED